ncbi:MAG: twin-arginine translocase subunit TatC [Planctomycetes bacterium]|nr:twin-arginine translocase subunit TatC [Planctomycetota bacterium]
MTVDRDPDATRGSMSFGDHLEELRRRLLWAIALPIPLAVLAFSYAEPIRDFLCAPAINALKAHDLPAQLQVLSPIEALSTDMYLAMITAIVASSPWILWQAWKFIEPGLYAHEKRFVRFLIPLSTLLTISGFLLLYFVLMPLMLDVLVSFGSETPSVITAEANSTGAETTAPALPSIPILSTTPSHVLPGQMWLTPDHKLIIAAPHEQSGIELFSVPLMHATRLAQQFRLADYLDFTLNFILGTCIAFQAPLVVLLLGWIGVFEVKSLGKFRRYAIFLALFLSAIITPTGDPISLFIMFVPLYLLYELGIILLRIAPPQAVAGGEVSKRFARLFRGDR